MRLYRQFRHLRRSVRPNLNKSLNAESHLVINRDKTKKIIYILIIFIGKVLIPL
ncbi:hypothetical protein [Clostridium pasteurianum]|uniref:hypothetical protein n=1 Tax=Clostridium pasteurianum TaxID=1501 RepID=UPI0015C3AC78|nr:hypothetical protein [Clostridium pasteurianum]